MVRPSPRPSLRSQALGPVLTTLALAVPVGAQDCIGPVWDAPLQAELAVVEGGVLHIAGRGAGPFPERRVARREGGGWTVLPGRFDGRVRDLALTASGLVAGGDFTHVDGAPRARVARFDGFAWQALGAGVDGSTASVRALAEFGGELYVGGAFAGAGGVTTPNLARWDGLGWLDVGGGLDAPVDDLATYGPDLAVAGAFTNAGGLGLASVARWDGVLFSPYGSTPLPPVSDLDARGPRLAAAATGTLFVFEQGAWTTPGEQPLDVVARRVALYDDGVVVSGEWNTFCLSWSGDPCLIRARFDARGWSILAFDDLAPALDRLSLASASDGLYETGGSDGLVRMSDAPTLNALTIPGPVTWYQPFVVNLLLGCQVAGEPVTVTFEGATPLTATPGTGTGLSVTVPAGWVASTGSLDASIEHAGETIGVPDAVRVDPFLDVTTDSLFSNQVFFRVLSASGQGTAWILAAVDQAPTPLPVPPLFAGLGLDLATTVQLGAGALSTTPQLFATLTLPLPPGLPAGLSVPTQAVVVETPPGGPFAAFTQVAAIEPL